MGVRYIYALRARLFVILFSNFNGMNFLNSYTHVVSYIYEVQINYVVYDHLDTSIEDMVIGSQN